MLRFGSGASAIAMSHLHVARFDQRTDQRLFSKLDLESIVTLRARCGESNFRRALRLVFIERLAAEDVLRIPGAPGPIGDAAERNAGIADAACRQVERHRRRGNREFIRGAIPDLEIKRATKISLGD